jgi:hypothetical protein
MALNRCVAQRAPAANDACASAAVHSAWPRLTTAPACRQPRDLVGRHRRRRNGDHQCGQGARGLFQQRQVLRVHRADQVCVMRPLPPWVEVRPLQVQAKEPRHTVPGRRDPRRDHGARGIPRVGDQRRQDARGPKPGMGRADPGEGGGVR